MIFGKGQSVPLYPCSDTTEHEQTFPIFQKMLKTHLKCITNQGGGLKSTFQTRQFPQPPQTLSKRPLIEFQKLQTSFTNSQRVLKSFKKFSGVSESCDQVWKILSFQHMQKGHKNDFFDQFTGQLWGNWETRGELGNGFGISAKYTSRNESTIYRNFWCCTVPTNIADGSRSRQLQTLFLSELC